MRRGLSHKSSTVAVALWAAVEADYSHRDKRVPAYGAHAALLVHLGFAWMINFISLATAASPSA
ncbi:hypothetical protein [Streptomyces sp. NPDC101166]|uniref:hypothetical protein n=1 Tax=Streptomyces sp. NPDC101166 TaxID=3366120 RepID=UPI00382EBC5B